MNIRLELTRMEEIIDESLKSYINKNTCYQGRIFEAMNYSLFTAGKRLRPIMAIKTYEMFNNEIEKVLPFASAIEMIHTYSLIHDDLPSMDNDEFRRGKPTNHKVFGEAMAILAGDGLLNLAFETMSAYINNESFTIEDYKRNIKAMNEISKYSGTEGMIGGQVVDLLSGFDNMTEDKLIFMYKTKTAALFKASIVSGAILGGANADEIEILREFALHLGIAYQIRDDLLDIDEDKKINKLTYLSYYDKNKSEEEVSRLSEYSLQLLRSLKGRDTVFLQDLTNLLIDRKI